MDSLKKKTWFRKTTTAAILPLAALGVAGCNSTSGSEQGADVENVAEDKDVAYNGVYDQQFYDAYGSYLGETVTVSADVNEILTNKSFTIAGTDDTTVEPLLVLHEKKLKELEPGLTVEVTGTVLESFDLPTVEEEMDVELDDNAFDQWDGENFIHASNVDTSVAADS